MACRSSPNLPPNVTQFGTTIRKSTGLPLFAFALYSPHRTHDSLFLANYANININDQILRVPGAGQVLLFGATDYAMRIWIKPQVLAKLGLTVADLVTALNQQNAVNPAGQVAGNPAPAGTAMTYTIRTPGAPGRWRRSLARLSSAPIQAARWCGCRTSPASSSARSVTTKCRASTASQAASSRCFWRHRANAVAVADGVKQVMARLQTNFPPDLAYSSALDTTLPVTEGIREILVTLVIAMALVILVVYLFLQNWRATLIPLVAVPVSLIGTFAVFPALGFSINTLSLFGLVLAIGLVVDDAIVVVEAVEHYIEHGMSPTDATLRSPCARSRGRSWPSR